MPSIADLDLYEILDERFRTGRCANGDSRPERLYDDCRWAEGPLYLPAWRRLVWSDIPNDRMLRWDEATGAVSVFRSPPGRQHPGPRRPPDHLRAGQPARHPHRTGRHPHGHRRPLRRQAAQQPERRRGALGRLDLVLRPGLRHHQRLRRPPRTGRDRRVQPLPRRPGDGRGAPRRGRVPRPERPGLLTRRERAVRGGHPGGPHPRVQGRRGRHADGRPCLRRVPVSNIAFGGPKNNRLFITATTSLYSLVLSVTGLPRVLW